MRNRKKILATIITRTSMSYLALMIPATIQPQSSSRGCWRLMHNVAYLQRQRGRLRQSVASTRD